MRGAEILNGHPIRVYDNGGKTADRYTVVFMDQPESDRLNGHGIATGRSNVYGCLGMSEAPFHPQGFGQHSAATIGKHLGRRIPFASLPDDCQRAVKNEWCIVYECGICGCFHPWEFDGDCRDDAKRFGSPEEYAESVGYQGEVEVRSMDERVEADGIL